MTNKKKIALVIGSGSVKCAAALGLQQVLSEADIELDMVVGTSGGSLYATTMALGYSAEKTIELTSKLWTKEITKHANRWGMLQMIFPKLLSFGERWGMRKDHVVNQRLAKVFGAYSFEDMQIPLYITATNFEDGSQVVFSKPGHDLVSAIRASISIPLVFPAVRYEDQLLVDGYLSDPLPVGVAIKEGANIIIAIGFESPYQRELNSVLRYIFQITSVASNNLLKSNFAFHNLAHFSEVILIVPEFEQRIRLFSTDKFPYVIEKGKEAMREQIDYVKALLAA